MGKEELLHLYRQLDKECALLSRYQLEEKETQEAFIPDKDNMKKIWERWKSLCRRVATGKSRQYPV